MIKAKILMSRDIYITCRKKYLTTMEQRRYEYIVSQGSYTVHEMV